jgi:hypothetical protein
MKKFYQFLVAFTALGALLVDGRADIKVQVWPDKLAYDIDEPCTIGVSGYTGEARQLYSDERF